MIILGQIVDVEITNGLTTFIDVYYYENEMYDESRPFTEGYKSIRESVERYYNTSGIFIPNVGHK